MESLELDSFGISIIPSSLVGVEEIAHINAAKAEYLKIPSILIRRTCMSRDFSDIFCVFRTTFYLHKF